MNLTDVSKEKQNKTPRQDERLNGVREETGVSPGFSETGRSSGGQMWGKETIGRELFIRLWTY